MSISGIESVSGFTPLVTPKLDAAAGMKGASATEKSSPEFGNLVLDGLNRLESVQHKSDGLAVQAATGDLAAIHQYTIAASEAAATTQLTVAVRNKALEAFNEIMRMPI